MTERQIHQMSTLFFLFSPFPEEDMEWVALFLFFSRKKESKNLVLHLKTQTDPTYVMNKIVVEVSPFYEN